MMDYAGRVAQADTYPKLLRLNAREHGSEIALREKDFGLWKLFTWNDYQSRVRDFALGMVELGLGRGDVIGIIGRSVFKNIVRVFGLYVHVLAIIARSLDQQYIMNSSIFKCFIHPGFMR